MLISLLIISNTAISQIQLGISGSLRHGELNNNSESSFFESNTVSGIGLLLRMQLSSKFYTYVGIKYQKVAWKSLSYDNHELSVDAKWRANSIILASNIGYNIVDLNRFQIGISVGNNIGINTNQRFSSVVPDNSGASELCVREFFTKSIDLNLDLIYDISQTTKISLSPNWMHYLHFDKNKYQHRNLGIELSVFSNLYKDEKI